MAIEEKTKQPGEVQQLGYKEDPGVPGGGKDRVDTTQKSNWVPPQGPYPPGEGYEESGHSGVLLPERFAEKQGTGSESQGS